MKVEDIVIGQKVIRISSNARTIYEIVETSVRMQIGNTKANGIAYKPIDSSATNARLFVRAIDDFMDNFKVI